MFNSISDSVIGDEENFVAAIEYEPGKDYAGAVGHANRIRVENRKEYLIRLYAHNNSPNGESATSENTRVSFSIPTATDKEVHVHGYIYSDNALRDVHFVQYFYPFWISRIFFRKEV